MSNQASQAPKPQQQSGKSLFANLAFNIVIPVLILSKFSGEAHLGPIWGLVVALAFPIGFGIYELVQSGKMNFLSIVGIISVLLTGGMSLLQLDPKYIAIKEAAVPGIIAVLVLVSGHTRFPLVKTLLQNMQLLDLAKLQQKLSERNNEAAFEATLANANRIIGLSFVFSSALNYGLARWILVSQPGSEAYNAELARMTALSYPVIALPCTVIMMGAVWYIFSRIPKLTGESLESFINE